MKKFINRMLVCVLFFNTMDSFSQEGYRPGYFINNNNDTIYGLLFLRSDYQNSLICTYKQEEKSDPNEFDPSQIQSYRFINGKYYVSKIISIESQKKNVFLEYMLEGKVRLYYYKDMFDTYYFIQKDTSGLLLIQDKEILFTNNFGDQQSYKNNHYKGVLKYLFSDDKKIYPQIDKAKFESKSLIELSKKYHQDMCPDKECIIFEKQKTSFWWLAPMIGYSKDYLKLSTPSDYATQNRIRIGIRARYISNNTGSRWNFITGINFSKVNVKGDFVNTVVGDNYKRTFHVSVNSFAMSIPMQMEYNIVQKKLSVGCYAGIDNFIYIYPEYSVKQASSGTWNTNFQKYNLGFNAGIDFKYSINKKSNIILQTGFEYRSPFFDRGYVLDYISFRSIPIIIGYEYKFK